VRRGEGAAHVSPPLGTRQAGLPCDGTRPYQQTRDR
jgi:hypothetical protein